MLQLQSLKKPSKLPKPINFKLDRKKPPQISDPISTIPDWKTGHESFSRVYASLQLHLFNLLGP